jgi:SNF2 family DNA or RNA helicase
MALYDEALEARLALYRPRAPAIGRPGVPALWSHQGETVALCRRSPIIYDASDPGTGKTRAHLHAWWERRLAGGGCALVFAPLTLLDTAWGNDIREYFWPRMRYQIAYAHNREKAFKASADIYITNLDAVKWISDIRLMVKFLQRFDTVIIDEATAFKHQSSDRSAAAREMIQKISRGKPIFKYRHMLSGTPNSNTILDMWHQIKMLDGGKRLGKVHSQFRAGTCEYIKPENGPSIYGRWVEKPTAEIAVARLISDISIRHEFDECMDIPPNHTTRVKFEMSTKQREAYMRFEDETILLYEKQVIKAVNPAVLRTKLLQLASGAVYAEGDTEGIRPVAILDTGRTELICELIHERDLSLTFFNWRHQRDQLTKHLTKRKVSWALIDGSVSVKKREAIVAAYQEGRYRTLLLHPKTGAHGLTLTRGTSVIWSSPIYEADLLKQGKHRVYRGGQTQRTEQVYVEAANTVERLVYRRAHDKTIRMMNLLGMIRQLQEERKNK